MKDRGYLIEVAQAIIKQGLIVYIAESGSHGCFTDKDGSRVVAFQIEIGCLSFSGNYRPVNYNDGRYIATGWLIDQSNTNCSKIDFNSVLYSSAPRWAVRDYPFTYCTLDRYMQDYQKSSRFTLFNQASV